MPVFVDIGPFKDESDKSFVVAPGWQVVGTMYTEGRPALVLANESLNKAEIRLVRFPNVNDRPWTLPAPGDWRIVGSGCDLGPAPGSTVNRYSELLLQNKNTRELALWFPDGGPGGLTATLKKISGSPGVDWRVEGFARCVPGQSADILLQHGPSREIRAWTWSRSDWSIYSHTISPIPADGLVSGL